MNKRQKTALANPVVNVFDTSQLTKLTWQDLLGERHIRVMLSVDAADDKPQWHASISVRGDDGKPLPAFGVISVDEGEEIMNRLQRMLQDVGTGDLSMIKPTSVFHMFKSLSVSEKQKLRKFEVTRN